MTSERANIAVVGAGWWSQGWHLPQLKRNEVLAAIVDRIEHPKSNLNPDLKPLEVLRDEYQVPIFSSVEDLLRDVDVGPSLDGILVATPHATHSEIGETLLTEARRRKGNGEKRLNIMMEKPMTTDVHEAKKLHDLVMEYQKAGGDGVFLINHSANYRQQARTAREIIAGKTIGEIRHISASFASPLIWIFDNPANTGWNEPSGSMQGNGFAWGQSSHLLGWVFHVCPGLVPEKVFCMMNNSEATGADISHAAAVVCRDGAKQNVVMSISGTTLLPGNAHSEPPIGKMVDIKIYGTEGAIIYSGDDQDHASGSLELRDKEGHVHLPCGRGFDFENIAQGGMGPESLQSFISLCRCEGDFYVGADSLVGLKTVQTLEAFYRSNVSRQQEDILYND